MFHILQLVQALLESQASSLQARETWGHSILATGLWPDSVPSALFATEDSCLSAVRSDGQILAYCLNRMSLRTSSWTRSAEPLVCSLGQLLLLRRSASPAFVTLHYHISTVYYDYYYQSHLFRSLIPKK